MVQSYDNLAQLRSCLDGWDVELIQLAPERRRSVARSVTLSSARIVRLQAGKQIVIRGTASADLDSLILSASHSAAARWRGEPIDDRRFAVAGRGARVDFLLPADAALCIISIDTLGMISARRLQLRSTSPQQLATLLSFAESVVDGDIASDERCVAGPVDEDLARRIRSTLDASEVLMPGVIARNLRAAAVELACRYIESSLAKPMTLAQLSRHCGVGVRTLEYGFRQFYDTTPISFIKSQRLTRTNGALLQAGAQTTSISKIARRTGFTHMGQYCQDYRALFGESPSMTLQRSLQREGFAADAMPAGRMTE